MALDLGGHIKKESTKRFLSTTFGFLCETSKEPRDGFELCKAEIQGKMHEKYLRKYDPLVGYVTGLERIPQTLPNGTNITKLKTHLYCGEFSACFELNMKDNLTPRYIATLANVDFTKPMGLVCFNGRYGKVLMVKQDDADLITVSLQPMWQERWLSREVVQLLKGGTKYADLSEREQRRLEVDAEGKIIKDYPYIREVPDADDPKKMMWDMTEWKRFLNTKFDEEIVPRLLREIEQRGEVVPKPVSSAFDEDEFEPSHPDLPAFSGGSHDFDPDGFGASPSSSSMDEDIPFALIFCFIILGILSNVGVFSNVI